MKSFNNVYLIGLCVVPVNVWANAHLPGIGALQEEIRWLQEETFVTTATRTRETIDKSGASVSVITAEELHQMGARTLFDALKRLPGLGISQFNMGTSTLEVRGVKTDFAEKVLFLINGHAVNNNLVNGGAHSAYNEFSVDNIQYVEVVRGPGSALYGADAFVAVINVITKTAEDLNGHVVTAGAGSHATKKFSVQSGQREGDWRYAVNLHLSDDNGPKAFVASDALGRSGDVTYAQRRDEGHIQLGYGDIELQGQFVRRKAGSYLGAISSINDDSRQEYIDYFLEASMDKELTHQTRLTSKVYFEHFEFDNLWEVFPEGFNDGTTTYPEGLLLRSPIKHDTVGTDIQLEVQLTQNNKLLAGLQAEHQSQYGVELWTNSGSGPLQDISAVANWNGSHNRELYAAFLQDIWDISPSLRLIAGARLDHYSEFGSSFNPRTSLTWEAHPALQFFGSYGQAFRAPTFGELYNINNPSIVGNPDVQPEEIETIELGLRGRTSEQQRWVLTWFYNDITDLIGATPTATAVNTSGNVGELRVEGFEAEYSIRLENGSTFGMNYTYQHPVNKISGERAPDIPLHRANVTYNHHFSRSVNLFTGLMYKGETHRASSDTRATVEDYVTVDLALTTRDLWIQNLDISFSAYNLFDKHYVDASPTGVMVSDFPKAGRSLFLEADYHF